MGICLSWDLAKLEIKKKGIWLNRGLGKWGFVCEWGANIQEVYANFQHHASNGKRHEILVI